MLLRFLLCILFFDFDSVYLDGVGELLEGVNDNGWVGFIVFGIVKV